MATIQERTTKNGIHYSVQVRLKGYPVQRATFNRKTDARKWVQQTETAIREGRHFKICESKKHTLAELISRYENVVLPLKTKSKQEGQLTWWKKELGHCILSDITPAIIAEYRDKLSKEITRTGKVRSSGTVIRYLAALSHVFTIGINEWGWIEDSPVRKVSKPKQARGRIRFLHDDERQRLLVLCKESSNLMLFPVVVLALATGMRQGEIMNLIWNDINLDKEKIILNETKNGEMRVVPLVGLALDVMKEYYKQRRSDTDFVFPSNKVRKKIDLRFPWEKALRDAQIHDFRFHDLRHSTASYLAMNGASLSEIADVLGHKSLQMVKRYTHLSEVHTMNVVTSMNKKIFG